MFPSVVSWNVEVPAAPLAPPVVAGGWAFLALQPGVLSARSLADGRELWTARVEVEGTPAATDDVVIVPTRSSIEAFSAAGGEQVWSAPVGPLTAPPLVAGGWLIVASPGLLTALRASDGVQVWSRAFTAVEQRPAAEGTTLYVSSVDGRLIALEIATGSSVWETRVGQGPTEPLALADRVYVGTVGREFVCLRAANGREDWRVWVGAGVRGAAAADADHVYFVALDNLLRALDRINGAARWKADLRYRPLSGPVVTGTRVTVPGMDTRLRAFDTRSGSAAGELVLPNALPMAPGFLVSAAAALLVAVSGSPEGRWVLTASAPPLPQLEVAPLTVLPGTAAPLPSS